jgi:Sortase domain
VTHRVLPAVRGLLALAAAVAGTVALVPGPAVPAAAPGPVVLAATPVAVAEPVRLRVPGIGVDAPLDRLGLDAAGTLEPPEDVARAGWYAGGPAPGAVGPAVLAGHVDSVSGPGVFARLRELSPGAAVLVDRGDGTTARFTVTAVARHPKDRFPSAAVYGPTAHRELRLVTCGGAFDRSARSYEDNVVVTAVLDAG